MTAQARQSGATQTINLAERLAAGTLRVVNRDANAIPDRPGAVHVSQKPENGFVWITGTDFAEGTIEVDIRGRDVMQQASSASRFTGRMTRRTRPSTFGPSIFDRPIRQGTSMRCSISWPDCS